MEMTKITAIIVEDEEASVIALQNYLMKYCPNVTVLGAANNIEKGYQLINQKNPDLVFLDVEMPFGNAFDLLEKFEDISFETIFVTAYSEYAMDALNLSACSYLLKPISIDGLTESIEKVTERISNKEDVRSTSVLIENLAIENRQLKKIVLPMLDGFEVVVLKDIVRCQANDNLTDVYLNDGSKRTICRTLKHYEQVLSDHDFVRIHKSHIVNINCVKQYKKGKGGYVTLTDGNMVDVSPARKEVFLNKFM